MRVLTTLKSDFVAEELELYKAHIHQAEGLVAHMFPRGNFQIYTSYMLRIKDGFWRLKCSVSTY